MRICLELLDWAMDYGLSVHIFNMNLKWYLSGCMINLLYIETNSKKIKCGFIWNEWTSGIHSCGSWGHEKNLLEVSWFSFWICWVNHLPSYCSILLYFVEFIMYFFKLTQLNPKMGITWSVTQKFCLIPCSNQ